MCCRNCGSFSLLVLGAFLLPIVASQRTVQLPWTITEAARGLTANIETGDTVLWNWLTSSNGEMHSVHHMQDPPLFNSTLQQPPGSFQFTFDEPGVFEANCLVHPNVMRATITVTARADAANAAPAAAQTTTIVVVIIAIVVLSCIGAGAFVFFRRRSAKKSSSSSSKSKAKAEKAPLKKGASKTEKLIPSRDNSDEGMLNRSSSSPPGEYVGAGDASVRLEEGGMTTTPVVVADAPEAEEASSDDVFDATSNLSDQILRGSVSRAKTSHALGPSQSTKTFEAPSMGAVLEDQENGDEQDAGDDTMQRAMTASAYTATKRRSQGPFTVPAPERPSMPRQHSAPVTDAAAAVTTVGAKARMSMPAIRPPTLPPPRKTTLPRSKTTVVDDAKRTSSVFTFSRKDTKQFESEAV